MKNLNFKKGFHSIHSDVKIDDKLEYVLGRLDYIIKKREKFNLSNSENKIIDKIIQSYEKVVNNHPLEIDHMILQDFEIFELKKISNKDLSRYLIYRYKYNIYPKIQHVDDYPPCVQIEPSSICNFRCTMCFHIDESFSGKKNGYMGLMPMDIFKKTIDELEGNVEAVTFASRGEPTINKMEEGESIHLKFNGSLRKEQLPIADLYTNSAKKNGGGIISLKCGGGKTVLALYIISLLKKKRVNIYYD